MIADCGRPGLRVISSQVSPPSVDFKILGEVGTDVFRVLAPVPGAVQTALLVGTEGMTEGGDIHMIRILGVDTYLADMPGVLQPAVGPGLAAVTGSVDTVAVGDIETNAALAHPRINHIGI